MNIIREFIEGIDVIVKTTFNLFREDKFDYLFTQIKLMNLDGHKPILRKTIEGMNYTSYLFTIPVGLSINDFEDNISNIAQYLHKNVSDTSIELVNNQALITIRENKQQVSFNYEDYTFDDTLRIPLGVNLLTNKMTYWNFTEASETHMILGGSTGSGKSVMLRMMISHIVKHLNDKVDLHLQDTKMVDMVDFQDCKNVAYYSEGKDGIYEELYSLVDEMDERHKIIKESGCRDISSYNKKHKNNPMKYKMLMIEELGSFSVNNKEDKTEFYPNVTLLLTKGRSAGILVVFTSQTPYNTILTGEMKNNINVKVGLKTSTGESSKAICGDFDALTSLRGKGHCKVFNAEGCVEIQGLNIQDNTIERIVKGC